MEEGGQKGRRPGRQAGRLARRPQLGEPPTAAGSEAASKANQCKVGSLATSQTICILFILVDFVIKFLR